MLSKSCRQRRGIQWPFFLVVHLLIHFVKHLIGCWTLCWDLGMPGGIGPEL